MTDRQTDRRGGIQTDTQTDRGRDSETEGDILYVSSELWETERRRKPDPVSRQKGTLAGERAK